MSPDRPPNAATHCVRVRLLLSLVEAMVAVSSEGFPFKSCYQPLGGSITNQEHTFFTQITGYG